MKFLEKIRTPEKVLSLKRQVFITICILFIGILIGTFSKFLDYRQAKLPELFQLMDSYLDFHNFLGGFAPWIIMAVCISIYSSTPQIAAVNVLLFFTGMVTSYYVYSNFVAGFFPKAYAMIWIGFTLLSPFLAFLCWYAKGTGIGAVILSAGIVGVLMNTAFAYGLFYVDVRSWLNVLMLLIGIAIVILHKSLKETVWILILGSIFAVFVKTAIPFRIW